MAPLDAEWLRWILTGIAVVAFWLSKRAIAALDNRQDSFKTELDALRKEFNEALDRAIRDHNQDQSNSRKELDEEFNRVRGDVQTNSEDIARLLERTKNL
jgi:hypothetical protein